MAKKKRSSKKLLTCTASILALQMAGCAMPTEAPYFDPRQLQRSARAQATLDESIPLRTMPTTQEDPLGGPGDPDAGTIHPYVDGPTTAPAFGEETEPYLNMTLQQCVQRAVLYNKDIAVAGYQPSIDASRVTEAEAYFDPTFFSSVQFQHKDDVTAGEIFTDPASASELSTTVNFDRQDIYTDQTGIKQNLVSGGQAQLAYSTSYNRLVPQRYIDNPFWQNEMQLQITQPMLRNFGADVNQAKIFISRNDARVSLLEFRKAIEENIAKVEEAYWQLIQAQRDVQAEESALRDDEDGYRLLFNRFQQHLISALPLSQAQTALEARRATLIGKKAKARDFSDQLKQLMGDPNLPASSPVLIVPSDEPITTPMRFDIDDQINSAVENRFELGEELLKIDTASVTYDLARNNTLPKLDFVGSVTPNEVNSNFANTGTDQLKFGHFEYTLGFNFEIPIGNREALAILRRTALQREQAIQQYAALINQVSLDVRQAARQVEATYLQILRYQQSRLAAQRALGDIVEQQTKGTEELTPEFVQLRLDLDDRLAEAKENENEAVADYNSALEQLERAKGTLLKYNNIVLQEEPYRNQGLLR